jgi:hypothetical protein
MAMFEGQHNQGTSGALCAICVRRPATLLTMVDKRRVRACFRCALVTPKGPRVYREPSMRSRVLAFMRFNPGAYVSDVREGLGIALYSSEDDTLAHVLMEMARAGELRREGVHNEMRYWLPGDRRDS